MMSFEEFAENVVKEIRAKVGGAFQIKEHNVIKNNNVKRAGIAVMKNEEDIGPCVYLDTFYREYESDGMKFDEIVDEVYRLILKHEDDDALDFDISGFKDGKLYGKMFMRSSLMRSRMKNCLKRYRTGFLWIWRWSIMSLPETMRRRISGQSLSITVIWKCGVRKRKIFTGKQ